MVTDMADNIVMDEIENCTDVMPDIPMDYPRIERAVREILLAIGENPDREGLRDTPIRVARMYGEIFAGLHIDIEKSFIGKAHVVYIPKEGRILGLSKIARIVDMMSRKPQLQERLTSQIADTLVRVIQPMGVAVVVEAEHLCMTMRGVRKPGSLTVTSALRGLCKKDARSRAEAMALIHRRG
jgi:GTP cyclohydrolase I